MSSKPSPSVQTFGSGYGAFSVGTFNCIVGKHPAVPWKDGLYGESVLWCSKQCRGQRKRRRRTSVNCSPPHLPTGPSRDGSAMFQIFLLTRAFFHNHMSTNPCWENNEPSHAPSRRLHVRSTPREALYNPSSQLHEPLFEIFAFADKLTAAPSSTSRRC